MSAQNDHDGMTDAEAATKLHALITDIRIAMLTTEGPDGELYSRPMHAQQVEKGGDLWFATSQSSSLVEQIREEGRVLATFSGENTFVVVRGIGRITRDPEKVRELWNPSMKAWFPDGPDDPDITLVRVEAERADYWDSPAAPVRWLQMIKSFTTETRPAGGDRVGLDLTTPVPHQDR